MKFIFLLGILSCALSVIMGAFGAHAFKSKLSEYSMSIYNKAVLYQMFHSTAIILVVLLGETFQTSEFNISAWLFIFGILIFSGSLYLLAITGVKWLGAITPIGGLLFIIGWFTWLYLVFKLEI